MKFLRRAYFVLFYALPAVLFFSYYPIISLGSNASMNFELSLPLIWLVIFDIIAFVQMLCRGSLNLRATKRAPKLGARSDSPVRTGAGAGRSQVKTSTGKYLNSISDRKFFLFSLFPLYATLSIFWSLNPTRAILTAGIIWLLFFAVFAIIYITPLLGPPQNFRHTVLKTFFISSAAICVVCWLQSILDVFGVGRETTLLCQGCVSQTFGFPHPSGFAIEPQFMGNLLLAPTLLSLWILTKQPKTTLFSRGFRVTKKKHSATLQRQTSQTRLEKIRVVPVVILACLFSSTLFLTFSRGAIYAFAAALVILIIFALVRHQFRPALIIIPVATFIFTLTMQGIFNVIGPIHDSFCSGVTKSLNQLSLGIIDLRGACPLTPAEKSMIQQLGLPEDMAIEIVTHTQSTFDGYIAESTDIRLNLNAAALKTWFAAPDVNLKTNRIGHDCPHDHPFFNDTCASYTVIKYNRQSILFGVGLGGAGTALYKNRSVTNVTTSKEIVQNQPISLLLELGLVGIILIIFSLLLAFYPQIFPAKFVDGRNASVKPTSTFWEHPALPLLLSLIIAYLVTMQFFSGLPNALQIYLLPPLLYFVLQDQEKTIALSK